MSETKMIKGEETWDVDGRPVTLRRLQADDLGQLVALTMNEGWSHTFSEQKLLHKIHPNAFWGLFEEDGTLICHVIMNRVTKSHVYISLYVTSRPYRGRGLGYRLFRRVQDLTVTVGMVAVLDSVSDKTSVYSKSGFISSGVKIIFYQVNLSAIKAPTKEQDLKADDTLTVQRVTPSMIDALCEYDRSICGYDRLDYLSAVLRAPQMIALSAHDPGGAICGYVILFHHLPFSTKDKPIYKGRAFYADSKSVATRLLLEASQSYLPPEAAFWFFSPSQNPACSEVFSEFGEVCSTGQRDLVRMTLGGDLPKFPLEKIYGVLSLVAELI